MLLLWLLCQFSQKKYFTSIENPNFDFPSKLYIQKIPPQNKQAANQPNDRISVGQRFQQSINDHLQLLWYIFIVFLFDVHARILQTVGRSQQQTLTTHTKCTCTSGDLIKIAVPLKTVSRCIAHSNSETARHLSLSLVCCHSTAF